MNYRCNDNQLRPGRRRRPHHWLSEEVLSFTSHVGNVGGEGVMDFTALGGTVPAVLFSRAEAGNHVR
jgi:hypothetical protein